MNPIWPITIVGCGGIGGIIIQAISHLHGASGEDVQIMIVDGDVFESENRERQYFVRPGENKAKHCAELMRQRYPLLKIYAVTEYLDERNAFLVIKNGHIIFSCVDNHYARKLISLQCDDVENVVLINGGNERNNGASQISIRMNGQWLTPALHDIYPEILDATQPVRIQPGCIAQAVTDSQLYLTNFVIASDMLRLYFSWLNRHLWSVSPNAGLSMPPVNEIFTDLLLVKSRSNLFNP